LGVQVASIQQHVLALPRMKSAEEPIYQKAPLRCETRKLCYRKDDSAHCAMRAIARCALYK